MRKTLLWMLGGLLAFALFAALGGFFALRVLTPPSPLQVSTSSRNTQVITAIERREQVVLLSLGIQGISERTADSKFFGIHVPGSSRAAFLQYNFDAKLGLEGKDVKITPMVPGRYRLSLPAFKFIGHDKVSFRMAAENNGVLSWVTPEIDPVETINQILNDDAKAHYVLANQEILTDQAKAFYSGIIRSVEPTAEIEFDFAR